MFGAKEAVALTGFSVVPFAVVDLDERTIRQEFELVKQSLKQYGLALEETWLVQANQKASVWRVRTDQGWKALKWIGRKKEKAVFSIYAHRHMQDVGFPVPPITRTPDGGLFLSHGNRVGFLADWIEGRQPVREVEDDWKLFIRTLCEFHRASMDLRVPTGVRIKSKLGGWPLDYQTKIGYMRHWYHEAEMKSDSYFRMYRDVIPAVIRQAESLYEQLVRSHYWAWVEELAARPTLCHSDYGETNTIMTGRSKMSVIDLDTVTYDLPIRDLRKVFESYLDPGIDLADALRRIIDTYAGFVPLPQEKLDVFLIDVQFPYKVYQNAKFAFRYNILDTAELIEEAELDLARADAVRRLLGIPPA